MRHAAKRVIQAMDRVTQVLNDEFPDLSPPDNVFALSHLIAMHHEAFEKEANRRPETLREALTKL